MESPLDEQPLHPHHPGMTHDEDPDVIESLELKHADSESVNSIPPPPPPVVVPVASEESDDITEAERLRQQQELDQQILMQQQEQQQHQQEQHELEQHEHHQQQQQQQHLEDEDEEFQHQQQLGMVEQEQQQQYLVQNEQPNKEEKTGGASDNCCDKFVKCLGLIPCPTLLSWIVLLMGIGCLTGGLLVATWKSRDLLDDKDLLWFMEYTIIGVVVGMFVVGTLLLVASHLSSEPTSRRVFNSFSKNRCAQGLNIFSLVLCYILTICWVLATAVLTIPVMSIINIVYCKDFDTLDLNYYGFNLTYTGTHLTTFKIKAEELLISCGVALGAAIIIVNSLICYIICVSSNIAHLRDNRFATLNAYGPDEVRNSKHSVVDTNM